MSAIQSVSVSPVSPVSVSPVSVSPVSPVSPVSSIPTAGLPVPEWFWDTNAAAWKSITSGSLDGEPLPMTRLYEEAGQHDRSGNREETLRRLAKAPVGALYRTVTSDCPVEEANGWDTRYTKVSDTEWVQESCERIE